MVAEGALVAAGFAAYVAHVIAFDRDVEVHFLDVTLEGPFCLVFTVGFAD